MLAATRTPADYAKIGTLVYTLSDEYVARRVKESGFKK